MQVTTEVSHHDRAFFCLNTLLAAAMLITHSLILKCSWKHRKNKVGNKGAFCRIFYFTLSMFFSAIYAGSIGAETINFEEPIFHPDLLTTQYCGKGVEFLEKAGFVLHQVMGQSLWWRIARS